MFVLCKFFEGDNDVSNLNNPRLMSDSVLYFIRENLSYYVFVVFSVLAEVESRETLPCGGGSLL